MPIIHLQRGYEFRKVPVGYSWTTLIFGGWVFIFRRQWMMALGLFLLAYFTWGTSNLVLAFFINRMSFNNYIDDGFAVVAEDFPKIPKSWIQ